MHHALRTNLQEGLNRRGKAGDGLQMPARTLVFGMNKLGYNLASAFTDFLLNGLAQKTRNRFLETSVNQKTHR